jgi:hypothetical protein
MYTIYVYIQGQWQEFLPLARQFSVVSQKEAHFIEKYDIEGVAAVISYFADQICWGPPSNFWKVVGLQPETLPIYIGSTYEVAGEETTAPPLLAN